MTVRLVLLRHYDRALEDCSQQSPLLPAGKIRAMELPEELPGVSRIYCSPFLRCLESVAHLSGPLVVDDRLSEYPLECPVDAALARQHCAAAVEWHLGSAVPGETPAALRRRCEDFVKILQGLPPSDHVVVVCSHQSTLKQVSALLGCPFPFYKMGDILWLDPFDVVSDV